MLVALWLGECPCLIPRKRPKGPLDFAVRSKARLGQDVTESTILGHRPPVTDF